VSTILGNNTVFTSPLPPEVILKSSAYWSVVSSGWARSWSTSLYYYHSEPTTKVVPVISSSNEG